MNVTVSRRTLREVSEEFLAGAEASPPTVLTRQGRPYKPSALRDIRAALEQRILPDLGALKVSDVRRGDVQALVNRMLGEGLSGSRTRNVVNALRSVYRHAIDLEEVGDTPCKNLRLPASDGKRERIADPEEAAELLAALVEDQALWRAAFFAGLRCGELQALTDDRSCSSAHGRVRRIASAAGMSGWTGRPTSTAWAVAWVSARRGKPLRGPPASCG